MKVSKLVKQLLRAPQDNDVYFILNLPDGFGESYVKAREVETDEDEDDEDDLNPGFVDLVETRSRYKPHVTSI